MNTYPIKCTLRAEAGSTRVEVYDDIGSGGWTGAGLTAGDFTARLADVKGPLDVHINSGGGSVKDGTAIANAIRSHKGPTRTIVDGMAASIASVIMQAGQERVIQPGAMVMIHDASSECYGNAADMSKMAADLDKHSDNLAGIYAARAGGSPAQWRSAMRDETWYTADEAVQAGLADKVGTEPAALPTEFGLAAYHDVPDRIVARLKEMPRRDPQAAAAYTPKPYSHESWENVKCPVCDKFNDDDASYCGQCGTKLAGRDDVTVAKAPAKTTDHAATDVRAAAAETDDADGPACRMCKGKKRLAHPVTGKNSVKCPGCFGTGKAPMTGDEPGDMPDEPDGGDASAALHEQSLAWLRQTPGARHPNTPVDAASVDESDWDGPKAMSMAAKSDDPAATYKEICAGTKAGDPSKQDSWALPYRYPGKPVNAAGVRNALSRLPQTEGLTNKAAAQALLERLMKQINPDYGGDAGNAAPAWITQTQPAAPAWLNPA